jgi:hypothetical protein
MRKAKPRSAKTSWPPPPLPGGSQAKALARVGLEDLSRLGWLLHLLNRSPETIAQSSAAEVHMLENEAGVFCEPVGSFESSLSSKLTASQIADLAQEIRDVVSAVIEGASHDFQIHSVTLMVIPNSKSRYMGSPEAIFRLAVARLIESDGYRIKQCTRPRCGRLFVRRKRALYCSKRCSQIEQFARYVRRHSETQNSV